MKTDFIYMNNFYSSHHEVTVGSSIHNFLSFNIGIYIFLPNNLGSKIISSKERTLERAS